MEREERSQGPGATSPFLRFLARAVEQLDGVQEEDKALLTGLRLAREAFVAEEACLAWLRPGSRHLEVRLRLPGEARFDARALSHFLDPRRPPLPAGMLVAPIERRGRAWGVLALSGLAGSPGRAVVRDCARVARQLSLHLGRLDRQRVAEVRERIDRKIQEQLRPKDLFYQLLHGLRSLVHYDHSAAVLIADSGSEVLDLVAEQLWWKRGKSERVGTKLPLADATREFLQRRTVVGFDRIGEQWRAWDGRERPGLVEALDHGRERMPDERRECCLLLAPLDTEGGQLGVLKVASCQPGALGAYEAQLLRSFLPQAAVAIRNLARATSLETGIIEAEKKHAVADLARGVSHDVNNAFGSVLPLVQQMRTDLRDGRYDAATFDLDLAQIEASLQTCRRIFGGMLAFARPSGRADSGNVRRAIENVAAILQESLRGAGVRLETELEEPVPLLRTTQGDLEQLILNLATNARDAMPRGGTLHVAVKRVEPMQVALEIRDTGTGIAPDVLGRIAEPFFTTKVGGTGLGLSICRSIVDRMRGHIAFESQPGQGTRVRMLLPTADAPLPGEVRGPQTVDSHEARP